MSYESDILTTPYAKADAHGSLAMPIYYTAAYEFPTAEAMARAFTGRSPDHSYSRCSNPTVQYLEQRVARATGALSVTAFGSGMAAICNTFIALAGAGRNVVTSPHLFGNTLSLLRDTLGEYGVETRLADFTDPASLDALFDADTAFAFLEVVTNPQLEVADLRAVSAVCHRHGMPLVADTTIVPFCAWRARDFGVDVEVISSTKYISGGATGLGGLVLDHGTFPWDKSRSRRMQAYVKRVGPQFAFTARLKDEFLHNVGAIMAPQPAYMETLGLETLGVRFRRQAASALAVAEALRGAQGICRVNYPGLPDNPFHDISLRQFGPLPGAMLTIDLSSREACFRFINRLKFVRRATNLFDHKSLAIHPASTIFGNFTAEECRALDVSDTTVRLSIGLEDPADIVADIRQAAAE